MAVQWCIFQTREVRLKDQVDCYCQLISGTCTRSAKYHLLRSNIESYAQNCTMGTVCLSTRSLAVVLCVEAYRSVHQHDVDKIHQFQLCCDRVQLMSVGSLNRQWSSGALVQRCRLGRSSSEQRSQCLANNTKQAGVEHAAADATNAFLHLLSSACTTHPGHWAADGKRQPSQAQHLCSALVLFKSSLKRSLDISTPHASIPVLSQYLRCTSRTALHNAVNK